MMFKTLQKKDIHFIIKWLALWGLWMGFYLTVLKKNGYNYLSHPQYIAPYFGLAALFGAWYYNFKSEFKKLNSLLPQVLGLAICSLVFFIVPHFLAKYTPLSDERFHKILKLEFFYVLFTPGSILTKWVEIFFQQFFIWGFVHYFRNLGLQKWSLIRLFGAVFFVLHIPLFFEFGFMGIVFILPSLFGAMAFAYCVLSLKHGYVWSTALHHIFYLVLATGMRLYY